ncbi:gluconolactonase [Sphingomonas nostoxanthinifaciens]|nr:gluconolactonase [Sphingomonas nostoxanthinifaciens]
MRIAFASLALLSVAAAPAPRALPGPDGGAWDYASVDAAAHRLYVARSTSITMFDLSGKAAPRTLGTIVHGHGVLPIPGTAHLLVTSGDDDSVRIMDTADGHDVARLDVGKDPDAAAIDAATHRAYVMNAKSGSVSVIDLHANKVVNTIALKPGLEFGALAANGTLFINDEDANEMEVVDTKAMKAAAPIALTGCDAPSGLAYDGKTMTLIAACANGKAAVVDARTRKLTGLLDIGMGPDAVILDAARRHAYIPCGKSGDLTVIALDGAHGAHVTGSIKTEPYARTGTLDPRDGTVYLPTAKLGTPAPGAKRGAPIPGTFHLVAVQPAA